MRYVLLILLLALSHTGTFAQSSTIRVSGHVRCGSDPVEACVVAMLHPSDSSMLAYAMTDKEGHYSLQATTAHSEVLMRVKGFNVKQKVVRIKAQTQILDFSVEEENIVLREVIAQSQKLWGSRDTLNYLVSAYTRDHDRSIGDVLRQLPGITIEDNGLIKYQGTPINHFYIENLDLLQGRYNLATQGIKAEDVATVQVLENHEHVRALQDQVPSERAAINLKLKNKVKGVWTKAADLGAGGYSDGALWDATLQAMYFGKGRQHLMRYSGDNMGRAYDAATAHYGTSSGSHTHMVDMVRHGSPQVGNSLFGYRHGVNLNNLTQLPDSATLHYNVHYSHHLAHGNAFSQTRYILPDDSERLLTEDISDRTHTHSANLQLIYEKNATHKYLHNTLSLSGQWEEGRGTILSTQLGTPLSSDDTSLSQALHHRTMALSNRTRWVHRTPRGRGFEWTSTNSLSSTPQTLTIGGSLMARQDIDVLSVSTLNTAEMLRNLRTQAWTLSATGHLNTTYTTQNSQLTHPSLPLATQGDMHHWHADVGVGPIAHYVKGTFQSTLRLPVALHYVSLNNAYLAGEDTDAQRMRLYLQPQFSLLWKPHNFTLTAHAKYAASETEWDRLLTATVMQNYRSLSRYRATLHDSYAAEAQFKVAYKDVFQRLFAHVEGGWKRAWSNVAYGTTLDAQAHTVIEAAYLPNHSQHLTLTAYGRKDIDWHTLQCELSATAICGESEMLRQAVLTTYRTTGHTLRGTLAFDLVTGYRIHYTAAWQHHRSVSANHVLHYNEFNQQAQFIFSLVPTRLFFNLQVNHTHNGSLTSAKKDYLFIGSSLQYKMSKRVELDLNGDNLTNLHTYTSRSFGDMMTHYASYHLRPLSVTLTAHVQL